MADRSSWTDIDAVKISVAVAQHAYRSMQLATSRQRVDVLCDRIRRASCAGDAQSALDDLLTGLQCDLSRIPRDVTAKFLALPPELIQRVLAWWCDQPRLVALLATTHQTESLDEALSHIELPRCANSTMMRRHEYDISITMRCETSLSHGSDENAGNAMLFRRIGVWTEQGRMKLPAYSGNALRGLMRDLLADHFLNTLGIARKDAGQRLALWFFHVLYSGGALLSSDDSPKKLRAALGDHGAARSDGFRTLRTMLPGLSLLGCAIGDKLLPGKIDVGDLRPACREWGTGTQPVNELMTWEYLTRHDNSEHTEEDAEHQGMIAMTEVLRAGTILHGGIDLRPTIMDMEKSALGMALILLQERGHIGGQNRRDFGRVTCEFSMVPDPQPYLDYLASQKERILKYLDDIGALVEQTLFGDPVAPSGKSHARKSRSKSNATSEDSDG